VTMAFGADVAQYIRESGLQGPEGRPTSTRRKPK
jgi:hypothetical protein